MEFVKKFRNWLGEKRSKRIDDLKNEIEKKCNELDNIKSELSELQASNQVYKSKKENAEGIINDLVDDLSEFFKFVKKIVDDHLKKITDETNDTSKQSIYQGILFLMINYQSIVTSVMTLIPKFYGFGIKIKADDILSVDAGFSDKIEKIYPIYEDITRKVNEIVSGIELPCYSLKQMQDFVKVKTYL